MKHKKIRALLTFGTVLAGLVGIGVRAQQNKDTVKVPGGLALSDFKGYEDWQAVAPSETGSQHVIRLIVANPVMIKAYREGVPGNGKPFPDGSKIAKIEWTPKSIADPPFSASAPDTAPGPLTKVEFIEKDSKRFADTHGWGYADFDYDAASDTFKPGTMADKPPQGNDARCGATCHSIAATKDFIFTTYPKR
ncbi:MAG TPA: cytochrome P460 family protein [Terriglobia bacterium]|nr:cytochrome P460 family protein [Terriglobia bacterium]